MGLQRSDDYAAYCFDEAVYFFGNYVEGELHAAAAKSKTSRDANRARKQRLGSVLMECEARLKRFDQEVAQQGDGGPPPDYDPTDPVSPETAAKMPPAVKFTDRQFADPADLFRKAEARREKSSST